MFDSGVKCPCCRVTTPIRDVQTGPYSPGECMNCRLDRSGELPGKSAEVKDEKKDEKRAVLTLPEGIEALSGKRYKLLGGKVVHGKKALAATMGGGENA